MAPRMVLKREVLVTAVLPLVLLLDLSLWATSASDCGGVVVDGEMLSSDAGGVLGAPLVEPSGDGTESFEVAILRLP